MKTKQSQTFVLVVLCLGLGVFFWGDFFAKPQKESADRAALILEPRLEPLPPPTALADPDPLPSALPKTSEATGSPYPETFADTPAPSDKISQAAPVASKTPQLMASQTPQAASTTPKPDPASQQLGFDPELVAQAPEDLAPRNLDTLSFKAVTEMLSPHDPLVLEVEICCDPELARATASLKVWLGDIHLPGFVHQQIILNPSRSSEFESDPLVPRRVWNEGSYTVREAVLQLEGGSTLEVPEEKLRMPSPLFQVKASGEPLEILDVQVSSKIVEFPGPPATIQVKTNAREPMDGSLNMSIKRSGGSVSTARSVVLPDFEANLPISAIDEQSVGLWTLQAVRVSAADGRVAVWKGPPIELEYKFVGEKKASALTVKSIRFEPSVAAPGTEVQLLVDVEVQPEALTGPAGPPPMNGFALCRLTAEQQKQISLLREGNGPFVGKLFLPATLTPGVVGIEYLELYFEGDPGVELLRSEHPGLFQSSDLIVE